MLLYVFACILVSFANGTRYFYPITAGSGSGTNGGPISLIGGIGDENFVVAVTSASLVYWSTGQTQNNLGTIPLPSGCSPTGSIIMFANNNPENVIVDCGSFASFVYPTTTAFNMPGSLIMLDKNSNNLYSAIKAIGPNWNFYSCPSYSNQYYLTPNGWSTSSSPQQIWVLANPQIFGIRYPNSVQLFSVNNNGKVNAMPSLDAQNSAAIIVQSSMAYYLTSAGNLRSFTYANNQKTDFGSLSTSSCSNFVGLYMLEIGSILMAVSVKGNGYCVISGIGSSGSNPVTVLSSTTAATIVATSYNLGYLYVITASYVDQISVYDITINSTSFSYNVYGYGTLVINFNPSKIFSLLPASSYSYCYVGQFSCGDQITLPSFTNGLAGYGTNLSVVVSWKQDAFVYSTSFPFSFPAPVLQSVSIQSGSVNGNYSLQANIIGLYNSSNLIMYVGTQQCLNTYNASNTQLNCLVPPAPMGNYAPMAKLFLTFDGVTINDLNTNFTYNWHTVTSVSQKVLAIEGNQTLIINGAYFPSCSGASGISGCSTISVNVGSFNFPVQSSNGTSIVVLTVPGIGSALTLSVNIAGRYSNLSSSLLRYNSPIVFSVSPSSSPGLPGTLVNITGTSFGMFNSSLKVYFNGPSQKSYLALSAKWISNTMVLAATPQGLTQGVYTLVVNVAEQNSASNGTFLCTIGSVPPTAFNATGNTIEATNITIQLSGRDAVNASITYAISSNPSHGTVALLSASNGLVSYIPFVGFNGYDYFTFTVTSMYGVSNPAIVNISVIQAFVINSVTPSIGVSNSIISISLINNTAMPAIFFSSLPTINISGRMCSSPSWANNSTLSCSIPVGAGLLNSIVIDFTPCGRPYLSSWTGFNYTAPQISSISPSDGPCIGNTLITANVSNLGLAGTDAVQVMIGSMVCGSLRQINGNLLTCLTPSSPSPGTQLCTVSVGNQTSNSVSYSYDGPVINSISGNLPASVLGGDIIYVHGGNFGSCYSCSTGNCCPSITLRLNGVNVMPTYYNDSTVSFVTPPGAGANLPLVISTNQYVSQPFSEFSYVQPIVGEVSPVKSHGVAGSMISVNGVGFSNATANMAIFLVNLVNNASYILDSITLQSSYAISGLLPAVLAYQYGNYSVIVQVGNQNSSASSITYSIVVNHAPISSNFVYQVPENTSLAIQLSAFDVDGDSLTYLFKSLPTNGYLVGITGSTINNLISVSDQNLVYMSNPYFYGVDSFSFVSFDGLAYSGIATVTINVTFVNHPPVFAQTADVMYLSSESGNITIPVSDPDNNNAFYQFSFVSPPTRGIWTLQNIPLTNFYSVVTVPYASVILLSMTNDGLGGGYPYYTSFDLIVYDSFNSSSLTTFHVDVQVYCPLKVNNNVWSTGPVCLACPVGGLCSHAGDFNLTNLAGFYPEGNSSFVSCSPPSACPEGKFTSATNQMSCTPGYVGERCGQCDQHYYRLGTSCNACGVSGSNTIIIITVVSVALVSSIILGIVIRNLDLGYIQITLTFFQAVSMFRSLKLTWPTQITSLFNYMSAINLNIEIVEPECYTGSTGNSYELKFYLILSLPIVITIVVMFFCFGVYVFDRNAMKKNPNRSPSIGMYQRLFAFYLALLRLCYFSISQKSIQLFYCVNDGIGKQYYFDAEPNRVCYQAWWYALLPYAILGIVLYVIGIPALIFSIFTLRARYTNILSSNMMEYQRIFMTITEKKNQDFKPETDFWDIMVMFRKLLMISTYMFVSFNPAFQIVLYLLIFIVANTYQNKYWPYSRNSMNLLETASLVFSLLILLGGVLFYIGNLTPTQLLVLDYGIIGIVCAMVVVMVVIALIRKKIDDDDYVAKPKGYVSTNRKVVLGNDTLRFGMATEISMPSQPPSVPQSKTAPINRATANISMPIQNSASPSVFPSKTVTINRSGTTSRSALKDNE